MNGITELNKLAFEFLHTIKDEDLYSLLQKNVPDSMYCIEMCYNYQYLQFLKSRGITNNYTTIFADVSEEDFVFYISARFNIQLKEVHYFEFVL